VCPQIETDDDIVAVTSEAIFVNFKVNSAKLNQNVFDIITEQKEKYGRNESGNGKTVIVEFSSPNIAKPFHAGHLRSTIIGSFIRNVYEANGWKTISMNYLGDWGKQYGLLAVGYERYGNEEELTSDPINHLFNVYVAINVSFACIWVNVPIYAFFYISFQPSVLNSALLKPTIPFTIKLVPISNAWRRATKRLLLCGVDSVTCPLSSTRKPMLVLTFSTMCTLESLKLVRE
jgi:hypothetical protein